MVVSIVLLLASVLVHSPQLLLLLTGKAVSFGQRLLLSGVAYDQSMSAFVR